MSSAVLVSSLILVLLTTCTVGNGTQTAGRYRVTYIGAGNTGGTVPIDPTHYSAGQNVTVLGNTGDLVKNGLAFIGWNTQNDGNGMTYSAGQTFIIGDADVDLWAKWVSGLVVTYGANRATAGYAPVDSHGYVVGQTATVLGNIGALSRTGYLFEAWNTQPDGKGNSYIQGQTFILVGSNVALYAKWAATIMTVAGNGYDGYSGDGLPADAAGLCGPRGVVANDLGGLFIADTNDNRIRAVSATGMISTYAGTGVYGFAGDGNVAALAQLAHPGDVAHDAAGNIYIADTDNHRIRKIDAVTINITTVAGNGDTQYGADGDAATSVGLYASGVAVDSAGDIYVADVSHYRIRKILASNGTISTVAGSNNVALGDGGLATSAGLYFPESVAVDASGNIYIADSLNYRIRRVSATTGIISTIAGNGTPYSGDGGPAIDAGLDEVTHITVDTLGNIYLACAWANRVRKIDAESGIITTIAGTGSSGYSGDGGLPTSADLYRPWGVATNSSGDIFIADSYNNRIRKVPAP